MKPLNRPMFRYGGPIKEGVMSGIREPKKDGGPTGTGLVGDQRYPKTDGREHHAFFIPPLVAAANVAARVLPAAYRGYKASRYLNPNAATTGQKVMNFFKPRKSLSAPMAKTGEGLGFKIGSFARTNPVSTFGIASAVPQAGYGAYKLGKAGIKGAPDLAKNYIDMVLPGEQFREPSPNITGKNNIQDTNRDDRKKIITSDASKQDPSLSTKSAEELRKDRVQRYRDIMDIKGMNKTAAYNSLIAASQLINQEGDFKGSIKDGSLISKLIGATSKAFDKPSQTKDAIDTLILKGEIEKDIKASDPSAKLAAELTDKRIKLAEKQLAGDSLQDTVNAIYAKTGAFPSGSGLAGVARTKGIDVKMVIKSEDINNFVKQNPGKDALDFMEIQVGEAQKSGTPIEPGAYVVKDRIIVIDSEGNVSPYL